MSVRFVALYSLSCLLLIASTSHEVVKRKAPEGQLYVFAKREGCVSVQKEKPCPVSWQLSPYLAKIYTERKNTIITMLELYKMDGEVDECLQAMERALCSAATPRCSALDGSLDYGNRTQLCQNMSHVCKQETVSNLKHATYCDPVRTGKHLISECVVPSTPTQGICPQPEFKMEKDILTYYQGFSKMTEAYFEEFEKLRDDKGERLFSPYCIFKLKELTCSPLYCSADENHLLTKYDQEECNSTIKACSENVLKLSVMSQGLRLLIAVGLQLQATCNTLSTSSNAILVVEPPPVADLSPSVAVPFPSVPVSSLTVAVPSSSVAVLSSSVAVPSPTVAGPSPTVACRSAGNSLLFQILTILLLLCLTIKINM